MELQDFVVKGVTSQMRLATPAPTFVDERGRLIKALMERHELSDWGYGQDFIEVFRPDASVTLRLASREVLAIFENVESTTDVRAQTESFFEWALETLEISQLAYVGVRSYHVAAVDSFEELNQWLLDRLAPDHNSLLEPFGAQPTDSGWVFEFHQQDPKHNLRIGPMTADQATLQVFRDKDTDHYPPDFLFLDVDRLYSDEEMAAETALQRWGSAFDRNLEIGESLATLLTPTQ